MNEILIPEIDRQLESPVEPFQCPYCDHRPFESQSGLRYHTLSQHKAIATNLGDHTCPECGYKSSANGVKLHRSLKHGIKGTFNQKKNRKKEKEYGCSYCEFRSGTRAGVTRHAHNHHPNETGLAMMRPAGKRYASVEALLNDKAPTTMAFGSKVMEKVMELVAEKIYNKLMEEM